MDEELVRYEHELDALIGSATRFLFIDPEYMHEAVDAERSEEHTSELQSLMRISYAVFCLKKKNTLPTTTTHTTASCLYHHNLQSHYPLHTTAQHDTTYT